MMKKLLLALMVSGSCCRAAAALNPGAPCFDGAACAPALTAPQAPVPAPVRAQARPVVISIVGVNFTEVGFGKLELSYFIELISHLKPGHKPDEALFREKFSEVARDAARDEEYKALPDDYLDARLAQVLPREKYEIIPIRWSRDPEESAAAIPVVEDGIRRIFAKARAENRPVYLVAHSWGTVLAHTALHRLATSDPEVRIDRLVTLGSPLVPSSWWMDIFMNAEVSHGQLEGYVTKPRNVAYWANYLARTDYFSGDIPAADRNVVEDGLVPGLDARVKAAAAANHDLRPQALRDLILLKSLKTWHFAYIFDFRIFLKTLKEYHEKKIFQPAITAELAY
jgi:pimeloyl-ACP methyl ester carboxylesterase